MARKNFEEFGPMKVVVERDNRRGFGYKVDEIHGSLHKVHYFKGRDMTDFDEANKYALWLVMDYNKKNGTNYSPITTCSFSEETLKESAKHDISARRALDMMEGDIPELKATPEVADAIYRNELSGGDTGEDENGMKKIKIKVTNLGLFMTLYKMFKKGKGRPQDDIMISEFCKLLALRGYGKGAQEIRQEFLSKTEDEGIVWIARMAINYHITDNDYNMMAMAVPEDMR